MKGKLSCPYRGSDPPVQGRSKPRTGENADPRREEPPPRPPRKKNTRTEAFASRARARSWNNWFRKKPGLACSFPFPFSLKGSRGKFSFPLPFSLTLQTATRRLLTTHPYSSDFPFVFLLFVLVPPSLDREENCLYCHQVKTKQEKDPLAPSQKVLISQKKSASTIDAQLPFKKV